MSSLFKPAKQKKKTNSSASDPSLSSGALEGSSTNSKYHAACDDLIGATKLVKAMTEAASFLGPLKSTCEVVILLLEKTKAINENIEGLRTLSNTLKSHIDMLENSWLVLREKQMDPLPVGHQDFIQALDEGLKTTLKKVDQALKEREKHAKGLFKNVGSARIEPGILAAYREEITRHSNTFNIARLGPEKPQPMGTQHELCLKGTREPILQEIRDWRGSQSVDKRIFWLCDIGGSGKSTVARTMSHEWRNSADILLGQFFFSKNARDTIDTDIFCSTLADDLASKHAEMNTAIGDARNADSLLTKRDFTEQFSKLISEPLRSVSQDIVFVIDAVDECKLESRKRLLRILLQELPSLPNLKILLTSRPESDIVDLLQGKAVVRGIQFEMQGSKNQSNMADI
ncbi:2444_t:CDS:2, partial [Acaulospora colombiana]